MKTNHSAFLDSISILRRRFTRCTGVLLAAGAAWCGTSTAPAANILWVSDFFTDNSFSLPGNNVNDTNFITMLQGAGHNVMRFNPPASQNTALTPAQITAINTNDLIIIGRASDSAAYQAGLQANQWNTNITRPIIVQSSYLLRASRMGWFSGETVPDSTPGPMAAINLGDPETAYLFGGVAMSGTNTVDPFEVAVDRNTSLFSSAPVPGGVILARTVAGTVGSVIVEFPAGTVVRSGTNVLAGYRMFFGAGSREAATPGGVANSGKDNLTPTGKSIFMRAVDLALNNGNIPSPPPAPTNLAGLALNAQAQLTWSATPLTAGYYIKRALASGGPYQSIATNGNAALTSFADVAVVNDTTYYYVVAAFNGAGGSADSSEIAVTPREAPVNVVAMGGINQVTVSWDALAGAASYTLKRSGSASGPFIAVASGITGTSHVDTTAPAGQAHYYVVVAQLIAGGDSGQSVTVVAATAPAASTINSVLFASTVLRIGWTPGGQATGYTLESSPDGVNFSTLAILPGSDPSYTNTGLAPLTSYFYRVQGSNSSGLSPYSNIASNSTPAFGYNINIANSGNSSQNTNQAPVPPGYLVDEGEIFGDRTNGFFYGWTTVGGTNLVREGRRRESPLSPDVRYDTLNQFMRNPPNDPAGSATWEFELTNGFYQVRVVAGDAGFTDSTYQFRVEGVLSPAVIPTTAARWYEYTTNVGVSDGRLTITSGPQALNHKFCFIDIYPAVPVPATFTLQPQPVTVEQSRPASLSGAAQGSPNLAYQWYQNDAPRENATNATLSFAHAQLADGGDYYLVVTNYAGSVTSDVVALTVTQDTTPPFVVSVGSLDGLAIGVRFNEELNPINAAEPSSYAINGGGGVSATNVTLLPDGRTVRLILNDTITGSFTVDVYDMVDLSDVYNGVSSGTSTVIGLNAVGDVGAPAFPGSHLAVDGQRVEIVGGGNDIWTGSDQFYLASRTVTGDFDMSVQVLALSLPNTIAKAALLARESRDANSRTIHVSVNPPPPGRDQVEMALRPTTGANSAIVGTSFIPGGLPSNAWLRLKREGSSFTGYRSTNGVDWIQLGQTSQVYGASMVVGLGVTSHTNSASLSATGLFQNFSIAQNIADVAVTLTGDGGLFRVGTSLTNVITVTNHGVDAALNTVVSHPIPAGFSFVSATPSQGGCSLAGGTVTCQLGAVASGVTPTISLVLMATNAGSWTNTATVMTSTLESSTANNSASAIIQVFLGRTSFGHVTFSGGVFSAQFASEAGVNYEIQFRTNLPPHCLSLDCPGDTEPWQTLTNILGNGSLMIITDPTPDPHRRFYRMVGP